MFSNFKILKATAIIFTSILISLSYFAINLNNFTDWIDEMNDAITYRNHIMLDIAQEKVDNIGRPKLLYNPHHIGFDWLGKKIHLFFVDNGFEGPLMHSLQFRNIIISSIFLGIFFMFFYHFSNKFFLSLIITYTIAFTCGYWIYSIINDTPIIHSVMVFALFMLTLLYPKVRYKKIFSSLLGIFHSINIFFHQSDAIIVTVIFFIIIFSESLINKDDIKISISSLKNRIINFSIYAITFSIIIITAYYYVGFVKCNLTLGSPDIDKSFQFEDTNYFFNWLILYAKIDAWGKGFVDENSSLLTKVKYGISSYFFNPYDKSDFTSIKNTPTKIYFRDHFPTIIGFFFISIFLILLLLFIPLYKKYNYILIANFIFIIVYFIFSCWWEPDYREFWVATMFSFWFSVLLITNFLLDLKNPYKIITGFLIYGFLTVLLLSIFLYNYTGFIKPNSTDFYKFI